MQKELYLHRAPHDDLTAKFITIIKDYYTRNPYRLFMPLSDLRSRFSKLAGRQVCDAIVADLCEQGTLVVEDTRIGLSDRRIQWRTGERALADRIEAVFESGGCATLPEEEVMRDFRLRPDDFNNIITAMIEEKRLVRLGERVTYHTKHAQAVKNLVVDHIKQHGGITAAELRDKLGFSRKYAVAILEYLDSIDVTKRLGDKRVLRK
jgi:selenocysteine-specific elongation factor